MLLYCLKRKVYILLLLCLCLSSISANGALEISNQSPLISLFGIPSPLNQRHLSSNISVHYHLASNFSSRKSANELYILDGETSRLELGFTRVMSPQWSYEMVLPLLKIDGGFLDSTVDDWHEIFGLPQAGRDKTEKGSLIYYYQSDGVVRFHLNEKVAGLGDIRLSAMLRLHSMPKKQSVLRLGIKLPTGDEQRLLGSGGVDGYIEYTWLERTLSEYWSYDASVGLMLMQRSPLLQQQRKVATFAHLGTTWTFNNAWRLTLQTSMHTGLFDSEIKELNSSALLFAGGLIYQLKKGGSIWLGVTEDIVVAASPDVVFHLGVDYPLNRLVNR